MKKVKLAISAAVVFAIVGSALAFKPLGSGNIYCLASGTISGACPSGLVQFRESSTGVANPCTGTLVAHKYVSASNQCINASGPYIAVED